MKYTEIKKTKLFRIWILTVLFLFFYVYMSEALLYSSNSLPSILPIVIIDLVTHTHNFLLQLFDDALLKFFNLETIYKTVSAVSYTLNYIFISIVFFICYKFIKGGK